MRLQCVKLWSKHRSPVMAPTLQIQKPMETFGWHSQFFLVMTEAWAPLECVSGPGLLDCCQRKGIAEAEVYVKTAVRKAVDDIQINAEAFDWVPSFIWGKVYIHTLLGLSSHVVIVLQPINGLVSCFFFSAPTTCFFKSPAFEECDEYLHSDIWISSSHLVASEPRNTPTASITGCCSQIQIQSILGHSFQRCARWLL